MNTIRGRIKSSVIAVVTFSMLLPFSECYAQATATGSTKATATLAGSCQISAQNVNFGQVNLQAAQSGMSSTSTMSLYCTKGSAYTINLAYGGVYGVGQPAATDYYEALSFTRNGIYYAHYSADGTSLGNTYNLPAAYNDYVGGEIRNAGSSYAYGLLTGAVSGDTIGYKITVPGDDTKIWNTGNSTYSNTGTGASQNFPIKATLQTGTNGSLYPTPDIYMDTVTATVSY